jgi:hypothetical protein
MSVTFFFKPVYIADEQHLQRLSLALFKTSEKLIIYLKLSFKFFVLIEYNALCSFLGGVSLDFTVTNIIIFYVLSVILSFVLVFGASMIAADVLISKGILDENEIMSDEKPENDESSYLNLFIPVINVVIALYETFKTLIGILSVNGKLKSLNVCLRFKGIDKEDVFIDSENPRQE